MSETLREIPLKNIFPSKLNPRLDFNIERLNELAASIREVGLLEPIVVRPVRDEFEVVVGERRYRACQQAGLGKVLAIIRDYSDEEVIQLNLIENVHREDLSAIEKGRVCKQLLDKYPGKYSSRSELAKKIGVSQGTIAMWLKAVEVVPEEAQKYVAPSTISGEVPEGKIDYQTAVKVGRSIMEPERQVEIIRKLAEKRLPVKERKMIIETMAQEPERAVDEVIREVAEAPIELTFSANEMKPIIDGTKTQSSRVNPPDPKIKAGSKILATVWEPRFAELQIVSIERKRLKYFDEEDAKREGGYTLEKFKKEWQRTHGEWDDDQFVYVLHFEKARQLP